MAEALVSIALEKLADMVEAVGQQLSLFASATSELQKLFFTFQSIQACQADAESRQLSDNNVKQWLSRLRLVAYDIEDLVEDGRIFGFGGEEGNEDDGNRRKKARLWFGFAYNILDNAVSRRNVARDIKEIRETLDQIDYERKRFGFRSSTQGGDDRRPVGSQQLTSSFMDESELFIGRENDKETIIGKLVSGRHVQVVAVVGIGGLGKTTLARQIYNDHTVRDHFCALCWVCVSETFDVIKVIKEIIEEVTNTSTTLSGLDPLQNKLQEVLQGKRFLLVLDDVWNGDAEKWNMLRPILHSGVQGSGILVTTRFQKVANAMNAAFIHELQGLSDDDSWQLFWSKAVAGRTSEEYSMLENVGREIAKKCRGVPLAITVMGSAMNSKRNMADWQNILASEMWALLEAENKILPALWLSYYNLPPQLKQCFIYCSMFPKDSVLKKDMLVRLWVAQGFIRSQGKRDIEDIGADYFDELVACSMFQEVEKSSKGKITCKMHDLLHDLAEFIATDEIYTFIEKSEQHPVASSNVRHSLLTFTESIDDQFNKIPIDLGRATKLRTLFLHGLDRIGKFNIDIFHQARFIRSVVFSSSNAIVKLPDSIGNLKHLRYLDLSYNSNIMELPESVSDLRNLHTLNLSYCVKLKKLPQGMGEMVSLRHLEIEGTNRLKYLPKGLGRISDLRSLCKFIVGGGGEERGCGIDELQPLKSLRGSLRIRHLERVSSREEAEEAELQKKKYLCSLVLEMSSRRNDDAQTETVDSVLEGLRPHKNLEKLKITRFTGSKLPIWMDEMGCLQRLVLFSSPILERVPCLRSLKQLEIFELRNEILPNEGWGQLAALQKLKIYHCEALVSLPRGLCHLPLQTLGISNCPRLWERYKRGGVDWPTIAHISYIYINGLVLQGGYNRR